MSLANKRRKLPYHPMPSSSALRLQIERAVEHRFPSALTPIARTIHEVAATGIAEVDELLDGGLPVGAISELTGPESSGRTSLALAFVAQRTATDQMCAWVDVADAFDQNPPRQMEWLCNIFCGYGAIQIDKRNPSLGLGSTRHCAQLICFCRWVDLLPSSWI